MEPDRDQFEIVAELEAMRPRPRPAFSAELDARVTAGFAGDAGGAASWHERVRHALGSLSPRSIAVPVGATALAAIVVATALIAISESGSGGGEERLAAKPAPVRAAKPAPGVPRHNDSGSQVHEFSAPVPQVASSAAAAVGELATKDAAGSGSASVGPYAAGVRHREVERSARVVLAVEPGEVRSAAGEVLGVVHEYDGIVLRSSTRVRSEDRAVASFDLLIPSRRLPDALAGLSEIGPVRSRSDASVDVTAPTIGLQERARDARAKVDGLLAELEAATTDSEREAIEAELHSERSRLARLRSQLSAIERRTNFARVSVRVDSDPDAGSAAADGSWGVGDAIDDAGRILTVAAGVTVVALAILAPIALILLLALAGQRAWLRRSRERALDRSPTTGAGLTESSCSE